MADSINPSHYKYHPSGCECIDMTERLSFCLGNAVKYVFRRDYKRSALEDLRKAVWYLDRESKLLLEPYATPVGFVPMLDKVLAHETPTSFLFKFLIALRGPYITVDRLQAAKALVLAEISRIESESD